MGRWSLRWWGLPPIAVAVWCQQQLQYWRWIPATDASAIAAVPLSTQAAVIKQFDCRIASISAASSTVLYHASKQRWIALHANAGCHECHGNDAPEQQNAVHRYAHWHAHALVVSLKFSATTINAYYDDAEWWRLDAFSSQQDTGARTRASTCTATTASIKWLDDIQWELFPAYNGSECKRSCNQWI